MNFLRNLLNQLSCYFQMVILVILIISTILRVKVEYPSINETCELSLKFESDIK